MFSAPRHLLRRSNVLPLNSVMRDMSRHSSIFDYLFNYPSYFVTMRRPLRQIEEKSQWKPGIFKIDIKDFHPDDIVIKTSGNNLVVEAKHENNTHNGYESRIFRRMLSFPDGTDMSSIKCELGPNGVLLVTSSEQHRSIESSEQKPRKERDVPIKQVDGADQKETQKAQATIEADDKDGKETKADTQSGKETKADTQSGKETKADAHTPEDTAMNVLNYDPIDGMLRRYNDSYQKFLNIFFNFDITSIPDSMTHAKISTFEDKDDKFEVEIDTRAFTPEEVSIKVTDDSIVTVTARHEENSQGRHSYNHMIQRYHLPKGAVAEDVQSSLTADGKLTITAPKKMLKAKEQETEVPKSKEESEQK